MWLRIDRFPVAEKESSDTVLGTVKNMFEVAGTEVPDTAIDRAHRIGKGYADPKTKKTITASW